MTDIFLNSTALGQLFSCERAYQVICQWGYMEDNEYLVYGNRFHKLAETLDKTGDVDVMAYADNPHLLLTATTYKFTNPLKQYKIIYDSQGNPCVEWGFSFPYLQYADYRFIIAGTIDRIHEEGDSVCIVDHKTARKVKKSEVLAEYSTHLQIPFYLWAIKKYLYKFLPKQTQDKILQGNLHGRYHGIFISLNPAEFQLSGPIVLTDDMAKDIEAMLTLAAERAMRIHMLRDTLAPPTGMSSESCNTCWMKNLCMTRDHGTIKKHLSMMEPKTYDPRKFR